jgi:hypothetical protein
MKTILTIIVIIIMTGCYNYEYIPVYTLTIEIWEPYSDGFNYQIVYQDTVYTKRPKYGIYNLNDSVIIRSRGDMIDIVKVKNVK